MDLDYLALAGATWVPRPLAIGDGPERLSFVEGEVPLYPLPEWIWADSVLEEGGRSLRQLHDASIRFSLAGSIWQSRSKLPNEVICHNDFATHSLAFVDAFSIGAIDFDMCSPGPWPWDIAYLATRAVSFTEPSRSPPAICLLALNRGRADALALARVRRHRRPNPTPRALEP